jgi:hypothetical protein
MTPEGLIEGWYAACIPHFFMEHLGGESNQEALGWKIGSMRDNWDHEMGKTLGILLI